MKYSHREIENFNEAFEIVFNEVCDFIVDKDGIQSEANRLLAAETEPSPPKCTNIADFLERANAETKYKLNIDFILSESCDADELHEIKMERMYAEIFLAILKFIEIKIINTEEGKNMISYNENIHLNETNKELLRQSIYTEIITNRNIIEPNTIAAVTPDKKNFLPSFDTLKNYIPELNCKTAMIVASGAALSYATYHKYSMNN